MSYSSRGAGAGGANRPQQQAPMAGAWKPDVKPVGAMPTQPAAQGQTFTKTSLAINKPVWFRNLIDVCVFLVIVFWNEFTILLNHGLDWLFVFC